MTKEEAEQLRQWAEEYGIKFTPDRQTQPDRAYETHPNRSGFGKNPHSHVGPINHIPVK